MPIFDRSCPLRTPLTFAFAFAYWLFLRASRLPSISFLGHFIKSSWPYRISLQDVLARQWNMPNHTSDDIDFLLGPKRFRYAWECTSRHMFNAAQITPLMLSAMTLLEHSPNIEDVQDYLHYLAEDAGLANQLSVCLAEVGPASTSDASISAVQMATFILQEILAQEIEDPVYHAYRGVYIDLILVIARSDSRIIAEDTRYDLIARLCLCHLRYSLLYLGQRASDLELFSLPETDVSRHFSQQGQYPINFTDLHRSTLLLMLNSWQYNRVDASWRNPTSADWQHDASSCLVPLHDSQCCRMRYGPRSHVAACNALTMISHILDASDADRTYVLNGDLLERFFRLQRGFPLVDWQFYLPMRRKADRNLPASEEFISVIRKAGLQAWLNPGSDLSTGPPDDPHLRFLTRTFEVGNGFTARSFTLLDVIRSLAHHVDLTKSAGAVYTMSTDVSAPCAHAHGADHRAGGAQTIPHSYAGMDAPALKDTRPEHALNDEKEVPPE
ncbi:unnamed protein product [Peniophora sp. CBMAI 1063]|nr:unnamed protein product [Peniophora sp. CBMAI 1063]